VDPRVLPAMCKRANMRRGIHFARKKKSGQTEKNLLWGLIKEKAVFEGGHGGAVLKKGPRNNLSPGSKTGTIEVVEGKKELEGKNPGRKKKITKKVFRKKKTYKCLGRADPQGRGKEKKPFQGLQSTKKGPKGKKNIKSPKTSRAEKKKKKEKKKKEWGGAERNPALLIRETKRRVREREP